MYKFQPILKTLVWGTESWVLSGWPGDESVVAEGPEAGKKITEIYEGQFPLLIKFIDSNRDLSIQVHPGDEMAARLHGCKGKTEMWYVIKSDVGAKIYAGLSKSITPDEYEQLATAEPIDGHSPMQDVIATHEAHDGDLFFLPAGRLHAIGAGNFLAEIQETSDITYRVYDFGRKDAHGQPRELHIQEARDAIDYRVWPEYRSSYDSTKPISQLINCSHFVVHRVVVQVASSYAIAWDCCTLSIFCYRYFPEPQRKRSRTNAVLRFLRCAY